MPFTVKTPRIEFKELQKLGSIFWKRCICDFTFKGNDQKYIRLKPDPLLQSGFGKLVHGWIPSNSKFKIQRIFRCTVLLMMENQFETGPIAPARILPKWFVDGFHLTSSRSPNILQHCVSLFYFCGDLH